MTKLIMFLSSQHAVDIGSYMNLYIHFYLWIPAFPTLVLINLVHMLQFISQSYIFLFVYCITNNTCFVSMEFL